MTRLSIRTAVLESLAELTGQPALEIEETDDLLAGLGVDSLIAVSLVVRIEEKVEARLPRGSESNLVGAHTVGDLVKRFAEALLV